jgi:hypothetical protein
MDWRNVPSDHPGDFRSDGPCVQLTRHGAGKHVRYALVKRGEEVPDLDLVAALGDDPAVRPIAASAARDQRFGHRMMLGGAVTFAATDLATLASGLAHAGSPVLDMGAAVAGAALTTVAIGLALELFGERDERQALDAYAPRHPRGDCADERPPLDPLRPVPPDDPPPPPAPELDDAPPLDSAPPVPLKLIPELPPPS